MGEPSHSWTSYAYDTFFFSRKIVWLEVACLCVVMNIYFETSALLTILQYLGLQWVVVHRA